jgi:pimeloyl-ACP methyl ester carboxylesterase
MSYVTTNDKVRLHLKDWGAGRPVILMHGWPLSADTFDDLAMAIANAGMRAIAYDRRGFGRSDQPWSGYNYNQLADDLAAVIDYAGGKDATILGFSMGGGEVARYLSRHSGRGVQQAVLISSVVPYMLKTADNPNGVDQSIFDQMTKAMQDDRAKFWTGFFKDFYGGKASDEVMEWSRAMSMYASLKATLDCAKAFATTDFRPDLPSFKVPTLIIHGTADKTVPIDATARPAAKAIAGSKLIEYDGGPHGLFATHKQRVTDDVLTFLKG